MFSNIRLHWETCYMQQDLFLFYPIYWWNRAQHSKDCHIYIYWTIHKPSYWRTFFHFSAGQFCKAVKAGKDNTDVKTLHSNALQTMCLNYSTSMCYSSPPFLIYYICSTEFWEQWKLGKHHCTHDYTFIYFHLTPIKIHVTLWTYVYLRYVFYSLWFCTLFECRVRNRRKNVVSLHYRTIFAVNCRNTLKQHSPAFPNMSEYGIDERTMKEAIFKVPPILSTRTALSIPQDCFSLPRKV